MKLGVITPPQTMAAAFRAFLPLLAAVIALASDYKSLYGSYRSQSGHGHDDQHKKGGYHGGSQMAHDHDHSGYSAGSKGMKSSHYGKMSDDSHRSFGSHHSKEATKHSDSANDFGKDVKSKSSGYYDYKYVQPQYRVEKFHSDEKHVSKYGGDKFLSGLKEHEDGDYHSKGFDGYKKEHGSDKAYYDKHKHEDTDYAFKKRGHDSYHDDKEEGHYDSDYDDQKDKSNLYYSAPHHESYHYEFPHDSSEESYMEHPYHNLDNYRYY